MDETRRLARFVAHTRFTDLPRRLVDNCKIAVLDAIGAGAVGGLQPCAPRIAAGVPARGGPPGVGGEWGGDEASAPGARGAARAGGWVGGAGGGGGPGPGSPGAVGLVHRFLCASAHGAAPGGAGHGVGPRSVVAQMVRDA